jgi:hypothetical protein
MATDLWKGTGGTTGNPHGGDWGKGGDWSSGSPPGSGDTALLGGAGAYTVTLLNGDPANVGLLAITDKDATLDVRGGTLDVVGVLTDSGHIKIEGTTAADGTVIADALSINNGGTANIGDGGALFVGGALADFGSLTVIGTGVVSADQITVATGAALDLKGGTVLADVADAGKIAGFGTISGDVEGGGSLTANGGILSVGDIDTTGSVSTKVEIDATGTLDVGDAAGNGTHQPTITFEGAGAELQLDGGLANFDAKLAGIDNGKIEKIDLTGVDHSTVTATLDAADHELIITVGGDKEDIQFSGSAHSGVLGVSDDGSGGTLITICFMPGTRVCTPDGEAAVERLRIGDLVMTCAGTAVPVRWIGRQTVSTRFADPLRVLPIRIKAGALADNMPERDLLLSPDHAILVGDVLVQAGALVNGTSIVRETEVPEVFTYYHVECDGHELILAEGVPAETFVDKVERMAFDNWAEYEALYPQGKVIEELPYPRAAAFRQVPQLARTQLAQRGERLYGEALQSVA